MSPKLGRKSISGFTNLSGAGCLLAIPLGLSGGIGI